MHSNHILLQKQQMYMEKIIRKILQEKMMDKLITKTEFANLLMVNKRNVQRTNNLLLPKVINGRNYYSVKEFIKILERNYVGNTNLRN